MNNARNTKSPKDVVINMFVATDNRDWDVVEKSFNSKVSLDYSSMNGRPAAKMSAKQIIASWKGILPGFDATHHQLGNFQVSYRGDAAYLSCYGTASHHLKDNEASLWVVVGTYDFDLIKDGSDNWKISSMKFNFKYQHGNTLLSEKAIKRLLNSE